ncbi:tetratricopeptide repeat protein [Massilia agri]|uniref:Tetratricopeptide repeat protein n=1 Tax=Massilia agri TaxID=1886785 RepID=A0ABT2AM40_9BURK|nr:tetratricopeptide repeat protein [Massilia agri]MCS0597296.1 tetratricopeptide repeat protein [Massilia agri]
MKLPFILATALLALNPLPLLAQDAGSQTPAGTPTEQDLLYREALQAMSEGRSTDAVAMLQRFIDKEPRHAGAWLDLAISQCELGNAAEAERLFREVELRFAPPAGILEAIARYRATGCGKQAPRQAAWLLSATRGHDDNVNQGARDPRFAVGTGSERVDYELDPSYLPRSDGFNQLSASYLRQLNGKGTQFIAQAYGRRHDREHQQDTGSVLGALEHTWDVRSWRLRGTAALGYVTLDGALYQRQQQLQARLSPRQKPLPELDLALSANLSRADYPTRPNYNGTTIELGGIANYRGKRSLTQAVLTRLHDNSRELRPGGDRGGWFGSLQWYGETAERLTLEAGLSHQHWRSDRIYSPGLIEIRRLQNTTTLRGAAQWALRPHTSVVLEWRGTINRENISLFQYNSRALQLSLRWDNF